MVPPQQMLSNQLQGKQSVAPMQAMLANGQSRLTDDHSSQHWNTNIVSPSDQSLGVSQGVTAPTALMAVAPEVASSPLWNTDSGATHHVTTDPNNLDFIQPYIGHEQLMIGNGKLSTISHVGSSNFVSKPTHSKCFVLNNILYVLDIARNLLSVFKFSSDNSVYFEFHPFHCYVRINKRGNFAQRPSY